MSTLVSVRLTCTLRGKHTAADKSAQPFKESPHVEYLYISKTSALVSVASSGDVAMWNHYSSYSNLWKSSFSAAAYRPLATHSRYLFLMSDL